MTRRGRPERQALLDRLAKAIVALPADRPRRVGIDGVDGAGKRCSPTN